MINFNFTSWHYHDDADNYLCLGERVLGPADVFTTMLRCQQLHWFQVIIMILLISIVILIIIVIRKTIIIINKCCTKNSTREQTMLLKAVFSSNNYRTTCNQRIWKNTKISLKSENMYSQHLCNWFGQQMVLPDPIVSTNVFKEIYFFFFRNARKFQEVSRQEGGLRIVSVVHIWIVELVVLSKSYSAVQELSDERISFRLEFGR